ncbi:glutamine--fructose-6-phosphate transaminase (isomerizing) [Myxococcota bacterium]|nr:glutamine--fructose-6-phosphate transaminase (isomerizing) [Myxococcota bacterium]
MCGIVGYNGNSNCFPFLISGLKSLEYRGYDSAGVAILTDSVVNLVKTQGKLDNLREAFAKAPLQGVLGIGHTRWATHGEPNDINAHPHKYGRVTVVHNGIIENYRELKEALMAKNHHFTSGTDTEILAHLVEEELNYGSEPLAAIWKTIGQIRGTWGIALLIDGYSHTLWCAKNGSPLILGQGTDESMIASDIPALLGATREMIFLEDGDVAQLDGPDIRIWEGPNVPVERAPQTIQWNPIMAEKGGYKHFMLKEIFEQPRSVADTIGERLHADTRTVTFSDFIFDPKRFDRVFLVACGTSYYASLIGKYLIESTARIPVEVDMASEFRYRNPLIGERDLLILISQSGETADTLAALALAKEKGATVLGIVNVLGSAIARKSDHTIYTHAGPEIGVASTKAFTAQVSVLVLIAIHMGIATGTLMGEALAELVGAMVRLPKQINKLLSQSAQINVIARRYSHAPAFLFIGRGINYPVALEGALKLKEISYVHAEGYPAGEMKHGPIALIDEELPVLAVAPEGSTSEKMVSNIEEVKSRRGKVIAIASQGDTNMGNLADDLFMVPRTHPLLQPILTVIPLQLFAYYTADIKGTDIDQPRNLAKSVTVE